MRLSSKILLILILGAIIFCAATFFTGDYSEASALGFPLRFTSKGDLCGDPATHAFTQCVATLSTPALAVDILAALAIPFLLVVMLSKRRQVSDENVKKK